MIKLQHPTLTGNILSKYIFYLFHTGPIFLQVSRPKSEYLLGVQVKFDSFLKGKK